MRSAKLAVVGLLYAVVGVILAGPVSATDWPLFPEIYSPDNTYLHWDTPALQGVRRLMVSDSPETIYASTGSGVLWWDGEVAGQTGAVYHRVFLWHVNRTGGPRTFALTIENHSPCGLQIGSASCTTRSNNVGASWLTMGKVIAIAGLNGLGGWTPPPSVGVGQTVVIWSSNVNSTYLVGGLFEFRTSSDGHWITASGRWSVSRPRTLPMIGAVPLLHPGTLGAAGTSAPSR